MTPAPIHLAGERLLLDPAGALVWPAQHLLAVADLHLAKGAAFAARGQLLPPYDSAVTLDRLAALLRRWRPQTVLALGDSFHDREGAARLGGAERARLGRIAAATRLVWIAGNHDPAPPEGLGGEPALEFAAGALRFRHRALPRAETGCGEVSGHFHPKATVPVAGTGLSRPCFLADARRILLPAFGAYTGGLDISHPEIAALFPRGGRAFLLGRERLYSFVIRR